MSDSPGALLRPGLLEGASVAIAGPADAPVAGAVRELCASLGADVEPRAGAALLAVDCEALAAESGTLQALSAAVWELTAAHGERLIDAEAGGRIVYLCPRDEVAVATLENLARTLSIEWARYSITTVAIAPGERTSAGELAALVAYLASEAGGYFSGCLFDLRGPR